MKRFTIIVISMIVAVTLICTGVMVHKKREAESLFQSPAANVSLLAPPEGLSDEELTDFYYNNATTDEQVYFEDGKEVVEEAASYTCSRVQGSGTNRLACYNAAARYCRFPCRVIVWTTGWDAYYRLTYRCYCL